MKNIKKIWLSAVIIISIMLTAAAGFANAVQDRMKARIPEITALKNKGIIGENNLGFLAYVGTAKEQEALIKAENDDRRAVYQNIAAKTGTDAAVVGQRRAAQIAQKGPKGQWYQDGAGKWRQK
ncbi:MAG: hypothetical protein CSB24_05000 [Deltaproteobacteria bacterium]|nr:MAG: hypothetical protein CSB24_05000 [Deltaproteobacteria bacterium]